MNRHRTAVLVLGMHRSGTSALTRVLNLMGLELSSDLIPGLPGDNERGFWESAAIVEIHQQFLAAIDSSWDDYLAISQSAFQSPAAKTAVERLLEVLHRDFESTDRFLVKDPRICRLLPIWLEALPRFECAANVVLIARSPHEVAASLARRNDMPGVMANHVWLRHMLDMEHDSRDLPRSLVTYASLLEDWVGVVEKIGHDLDIEWRRSAAAASAEVDEFLSRDLRHHRAEDSGGSSSQTALGRHVHATWTAFCRSIESDRSQDQIFDEITTELARAEALLLPTFGLTTADVRGLERRVQDLHAEHRRATEAYEAEIEKIRAVMADADAKVYDKQRVIESLMAERERLAEAGQRQVADLNARIQKGEEWLAQERRDAVETTARLERQIAASDNLRQELDRQAAEHRHQMDGLRSELERTEVETRRLTEALERIGARVVELEQGLAARSRELGELRIELDDTRRDKDWLWERWNEAKDELAAPRQSRVGRLIFWQWDSYTRFRRALVQMKNAALTPQRGERPAKVTHSRGFTRRVAQAFARLPLRVIRKLCRLLAWLYLFALAGWERLRARLRGRASGPEPPAARRSPGSRLPRVLLVSPYPIYPANHGGGVRLFNLVQRLADHSEMHLLIFSTVGEDAEQREHLAPFARSVHFHHWQPGFEPGWWHLEPPNAGLFASAEAARTIAHLLASRSIDILQLEYTELGQYGLPDFARVKVVLTEHDLAFRQHGRRRRMGFHRRFPEGNAYGATYGDLLRLHRYELAVCRRADQIHVMSAADGHELSAFLDDGWDRLRLVPNAVDTAFYDPGIRTHERQQVLYVGNFQNLPNVDALEYLASDIWPRVRARQPTAELDVVGAHPSPRVTRFDGIEGINIIGPVPDLREHYHSHRLMVAPIRAGSGTRLKILEAFAAGLPVVSTTLGAEGILATHGQHLLIADEPAAFAESVTRLLDDDPLWRHVADSARQLAVASYDWQRSSEATLAGWEELLADSPTASFPATVKSQSTVTAENEVDISIIIPTLYGGEMLARCLAAISKQQTRRSLEVICVDSGSSDTDLDTMRSHGARVITIDQSDFDHGLSRDLGARESCGRVLVFLNQDAVPHDDDWLQRLTELLFDDDRYVAVQGGIVESTDPEDRFFWDSCGDRFYFTRESKRWLQRYFGIGFSTVNAAIRRSVWERYPFGRAPIMEDKLWQKQVVAAGSAIAERHDAAVIHTHNYRLRSLWRRCLSEGFGWRLVGERYSFIDLVRDGLQPNMHRDLVRGLAGGRIRSLAELLFPWLRPFALYWGNHWSRGVKL